MHNGEKVNNDLSGKRALTPFPPIGKKTLIRFFQPANHQSGCRASTKMN